MNKIELVDVSKKFGDNVILSDVSYTFYTGNFYIVKGKSGLGKSTIASLIGRIDSVSSGKILYDDKEVENNNLFTEKNISYVFQYNNLALDLTVIENLRLICNDDDLIKSTLKDFGILDKLNERSAILSKGEKNRLVLARIILEDKPVLLLDEPIGNLDKENALYSLGVLKKYSKNHLVIMIMHNDLDLKEYEPIILTISDKKLIEISEHSEVLKNDSVEEKEPRKMSFKQVFSFVKIKYKSNPLRVFLFTLFQVCFFLISFIAIGYNGSNISNQIADYLKEAGVKYADVYSNESKDYLYRRKSFKFETSDDNKISISCLYSERNGFYNNDEYIRIGENQLFVSNESYYEYESEILSGIKLFDREVEVEIIDAPVSYISKELVKYYCEKETLNIEISDFKDLFSFDLTLSSILFPGFNTLYTLTSKSRLDEEANDFEYSKENLSSNEINIILPSERLLNYAYSYDLDYICEKIVGKKLSYNKNNRIDGIASSLIIKGVIINDTIGGTLNMPAIEISEKAYNKMLNSFYKNNLLGGFYTHNYVIMERNFKDFDFFAYDKGIAGNNYSIINNALAKLGFENVDNSIQSYNFFKNIFGYLLLAFIVFDLIFLYFIISGFYNSSKKSINLQYTLGFTQKDVAKINSTFFGLTMIFSAIIAAAVFLSITYSLSNFYFSFLETNLRLYLFSSSYFIIPYIVLLTLFVMIFASLFKTKKNMSRLLVIMKKNI